MHQTVCQCFRHFERYGFICHTVSGGNHDAIIGKLVLSDNSVQCNLISRRLNRLRRCGDFIKKQDVDNIVTCIHLEWRTAEMSAREDYGT